MYVTVKREVYARAIDSAVGKAMVFLNTNTPGARTEEAFLYLYALVLRYIGLPRNSHVELLAFFLHS